MLVPTAGVAVAAGPDISFPFPSGTGQGWSSVQIANASPFGLIVKQGGTGSWFIPAFTADIYPLVSMAPVTATPVAPSGTPSTGGDSTAYPTWAQPGDQFSGSFPFSLTAQAITSAIAGLITTTPQLRALGGTTLTAGTTSGAIFIPNSGSLQSTDRYVYAVWTNSSHELAGTAIYLDTVFGQTSFTELTVNDVCSWSHIGVIPLTISDTKISVSWRSLTFAGLAANTNINFYAAAAPLPQSISGGIATADQTTTGITALGNWVTERGNLSLAPTAIRLQSAAMTIHTATATETQDFRFHTSNQLIMRNSAVASGDSQITRTFNGLLICNGALSDGINDYSPSALEQNCSSASVHSTTLISFDILAYN